MARLPIQWITADDGSNFLYEAATNRLLRVEGAPSTPQERENCIAQWINEGLLDGEALLEQYFPLTIEEYIDLIDHALPRLTLEITCNCNLRCTYCVYSGDFEGRRTHKPLDMSEKTMKEAICFYLDHSQQTDQADISFFGGEALVRFDLICEAVRFVQEKAPGRKAQYSISSNGLLLRGNVVSWLAAHPEVTVTVTINGPYHDQYRRKVDGSGSLDTIMKNLIAIRDTYPSVWENQIRLLCNYTSHEELLDQRDFFEQQLGKLPIMITPVFRPKKIGEGLQLYAPGSMTIEDVIKIYQTESSPFLDIFFRLSLNRIHQRDIYSSSCPQEINSCMPLADGLFVSVDGDFQICTEMTWPTHLGNLNSGYDYAALKALYQAAIDIRRHTGCASCWAQRFCELCYRDFIAKDGPLHHMPAAHCQQIQRGTLRDLTLYCSLACKNPERLEV